MGLNHDRQVAEEIKSNRPKNLCAKTRSVNDPYEIWRNGSGWIWKVLKKYQLDDNKPYARWFCMVHSPFVPSGEMGDVYVKDIIENAVKVTSSAEATRILWRHPS